MKQNFTPPPVFKKADRERKLAKGVENRKEEGNKTKTGTFPFYSNIFLPKITLSLGVNPCALHVLMLAPDTEEYKKNQVDGEIYRIFFFGGGIICCICFSRDGSSLSLPKSETLTKSNIEYILV